MRRLLTLSSLLAGLFIFTVFAYRTYDQSFRFSNIFSESTPYSLPAKDFEMLPLNENEEKIVASLLDQPFHYLGEGNQIYAFLGEDKETVLKFFKWGHLKPGNWTERFPFIPFITPYYANLENVKTWKTQRLFNAYQVAYCFDREHSGLLYVHLDRAGSFEKMATVKDRFGFVHKIPLEKTCFAIQKKAEPLRKVLNNLLEKKEIAEVKRKLRQVIAMYVAEYRSGIFDQDHNLMYNVGFIEDRPIRLDIGKIVLDPNYRSPSVYMADLDKILYERIDKWFLKYHPKNRNDVVEDLSQFISEIGS